MNKINNLSEKRINELLDLKFFIPSYQRGYRWTSQQITDLLEDIDTFVPQKNETTGTDTWYCLQPVVIKKCDEEKKRINELEGEWYEVIDGQQRLTSIFLILHYANEMWIGKQKVPEYELRYETRKESTIFLQEQEITDLEKGSLLNESNIDYYHISQAYNTIHQWVSSYKQKFHKEFDNNAFQSKLKTSAKVIWYEVENSKDAIEIFTRINMGKISLTDSELIKALFLNSSNFKNIPQEHTHLKQLEIASEWDRIEYTLHNDEFWYFIYNGKKDYSSRIEFIFELIYSLEEQNKTDDLYSIFRFFSRKFQKGDHKEIAQNWLEVKQVFQTLEEWFTDRELFHKIGYLITIGIELHELLLETKNKKKREFTYYLESLIHEKIKHNNLRELLYGKHHTLIRNILLWHNIKTMLDNKVSSSRFPFNRFKNESWDIEHVHAIATEMPLNKQHRKDWLTASKEFIVEDENLLTDINHFIQEYDTEIKNNPESFSDLSSKVLKYYSKENAIDTEINDISNLVLLDSGTNRSYKNAVFPVKRKTIIEKEKGGTFIPICTRNVFLKYYSHEVNQMTFWDINDGEAYINNIESTLGLN